MVISILIVHWNPEQLLWYVRNCLKPCPMSRSNPLNRKKMVNLPRIPRFSIWCGTRISESWHLDYNARAVVGARGRVGHAQIALRVALRRRRR